MFQIESAAADGAKSAVASSDNETDAVDPNESSTALQKHVVGQNIKQDDGEKLNNYKGIKSN